MEYNISMSAQQEKRKRKEYGKGGIIPGRKCPCCGKSVKRYKSNSHALPKWIYKLIKPDGQYKEISKDGVKNSQKEMKGEFWCLKCEYKSAKWDNEGQALLKYNIKKDYGKRKDVRLGNPIKVRRFILSLLIRKYLYERVIVGKLSLASEGMHLYITRLCRVLLWDYHTATHFPIFLGKMTELFGHLTTSYGIKYPDNILILDFGLIGWQIYCVLENISPESITILDEEGHSKPHLGAVLGYSALTNILEMTTDDIYNIYSNIMKNLHTHHTK